MKALFSITVFKNTLSKLIKEKWQLAMWILIPSMMALLFSMMSGGTGNVKPVGILVVTDNDKSLLSQLLVGGFNQGPMAEMFMVKAMDKTSAAQMMDEGKASVWLRIDKDFMQNFLDEKPTTLHLVKNPSQKILPQIAETVVTTLADGGHYIQLMFADELKQFKTLFSGGKISDSDMALVSIQIKNTVDSLAESLNPLFIKAKKQEHKSEEKAQISFMVYMFPGIMFMALLFSSQGMSQDFWKDKTQGVMNRLLSTPVGINHYLNGKMLSSAVVFGLIAVVMGSLGLWLFKIDFHKILLIVPWLVLSGMVLWSMMLLFSLVLPSEKSANLVTQGMVFPLMMLGGSFFPFDAMPHWMVMIGEKLPNGYLLSHFNSWFLKNNTISHLITPAVVAVVFIVVLWFVNHRLLARFARKK